MADNRTRPLTRGARALRDELLAQRDPQGRAPSWLDPATVIRIDAAGGLDGQPLVTVAWQGLQVPVAHLASYTPQVGDTVLLNVQPPSLVVIGRVVGTPPTTP